jgi:hypothetical protein
VAKDQPTQRTRDEADSVGGECEQGADQRLESRKEELVEDKCGGGAVDEEVVPLQRGADQAGNYYLAHR